MSMGCNDHAIVQVVDSSYLRAMTIAARCLASEGAGNEEWTQTTAVARLEGKRSIVDGRPETSRIRKGKTEGEEVITWSIYERIETPNTNHQGPYSTVHARGGGWVDMR